MAPRVEHAPRWEFRPERLRKALCGADKGRVLKSMSEFTSKKPDYQCEVCAMLCMSLPLRGTSYA